MKIVEITSFTKKHDKVKTKDAIKNSESCREKQLGRDS